MKTTYIYNDINGIHETTDEHEAIGNAEEPIIVKLVDDDGQIFLSVSNPTISDVLV